MRIFLSVIVVLLGANLLVDLLDSNLVDVMEERRETIEKQLGTMWRSTRWHSIGCAAPVFLYIKEVNQTTPIHA